jgi:hypothetical protein
MTKLRLHRSLAMFTLSLGLMSLSHEALAAGAALDPTALPPESLSQLKAEIARSRRETPELFKAVADVASHANTIDAAGRTPGIPFTMHFKPLGNRALFPLLEALVLDAHAPVDLSPTAASALRLGLIEAVGIIRDARALTVLAKILEQSKDTDTARAATEGLARLGTDDALEKTFSAATRARDEGNVARERAILSGLHDARRERAARFVATRLAATTDEETARVLCKALGGIGSAWAWKTVADPREAGATRALAATALVEAYARGTAERREHAAKAILVVDESSTPGLIERAKSGASAETVAALEALAKRFAANPTR